MSSKFNSSQNVSLGNVSNTQVAVGSGHKVDQQQVQTNIDTSAEEITQDQAIELLTQIEQLIESANLPSDVVEEATDYTRMARKEAQKTEPRKERITNNLEAATSLVQDLNKTTDAVKDLVGKLKDPVIKLSGWLGVAAAKFLIL